MEIQLLSINLGKKQNIEIGKRQVETGIFKQPVAAATVTEMGIVGDTIADLRNHGGVDQAIYLYSSADYAYWSNELECDLPCGTFGENITLSAFGSDAPRIGDRIQIGEVLLEVTSGRVPCSKLATRIGDNRFTKTFAAAERPGLYTRVLQTGTIRQNDGVTWIAAASNNPTVNDVLAAYYAKEHDKAELKRLLDAPISIRARQLFEQGLAKFS